MRRMQFEHCHAAEVGQILAFLPLLFTNECCTARAEQRQQRARFKESVWRSPAAGGERRLWSISNRYGRGDSPKIHRTHN